MNSNMFEQKYRDMQPETEDLLANGKQLRNGMVVLIESPSLRADMSIVVSTILSNPTDLDRAKVKNRWCEVSDLEFDYVNDNVTFVGTYIDGTKRQRIAPINLAWFVKKDSLPITEEREAEMVQETREFMDRVDYAEGDAEATMAMFPHGRALVITQEQLEDLREAISLILPEDAFKCEDEVWTLEVKVDEPTEETVTFTQHGTGAKATIPVSELKQAKSFIEFHGRIEDIQSPDGPLARALRNRKDAPQ